MTPDWLTHPVPLWAFLVAALTRPSRWSEWATDALRARLGGDAA